MEYILITFRFNCLFYLLGYILFDDVGVVLCSSLHGFRCIYNARVPQKTFWRKKNPNIPLSFGAFTLCLHQNFGKYFPHLLIVVGD